MCVGHSRCSSTEIDALARQRNSVVQRWPHLQLTDTGAGPYGITTGSDRALWLTLAHSGEIARLTVDGVIDRWPAGPAGCRPTIITSGVDDAVWFTRSGDDHIGRATTDGVVTEFELPSGSGPFGICAVPDDAMWFTEMNTDRIGRLTPDGENGQALTAFERSQVLTVGNSGKNADPAICQIWARTRRGKLSVFAVEHVSHRCRGRTKPRTPTNSDTSTERGPRTPRRRILTGLDMEHHQTPRAH